MEPDTKKLFEEEVLKNISKQCASYCFNESMDKCYSGCYSAYLKALNSAVKGLKEVGHKRHSRYIHLVYGPRLDEWEKITQWTDLLPDVLGYPEYYFERNWYDLTKDK